MILNGVTVRDTFAEAWDLEVVRLILTAASGELAWGAASQFTGAAGSSELGSRINAGIERSLTPGETPDGRPGVAVSLTMPPDKRTQLLDELRLRVVLATLVPTISIYDGMPALGDGVQKRATVSLYEGTSERWGGYDEEEIVAGRRVCVVPTTAGRFIYQKDISLSLEGTDGHIVCYAASEAAAVMAVGAAKAAVAGVDGASPMGFGLEQIFRELDYVPALRGRIPDSKVPDGVGSILNFLMFGASTGIMRRAMRAAILAACTVAGATEIGAMNFGGQFGRHQYHLLELLAD